LLHDYANTVWLLPKDAVVVRIGRGALARQKAHTSIPLCRWLVETCGFPATAPHSDKVIELDAYTVATVWTYYPQHDAPTATSADLGELLRHFHTLPPPPVQLPTWQPLDSLEAIVLDQTQDQSLSPARRSWLLSAIEEIRTALATVNWPLGTGLIHGDAWAGNLLWNSCNRPPGMVLGDWDTACLGPREVDLIPTWHAAARFGRGAQWTGQFAAKYGYDLSNSPGIGVLYAMRDLVQLVGVLRRAPDHPRFAHALEQRLAGIRSGDLTAIWPAL
jgi:hypothetical protein